MEDLIFEALALTGRAGRGGHEIGIILFLVLGLGIPVPAHQGRDQAFVGAGKFSLNFGGMPVDSHLLGAGAVQHKIPVFFRQILPGFVKIYTPLFFHGKQLSPAP